MGKLKRAQELWVDKFFVQKLKECHDTIQNLTSQIQELQERVNCMNDSRECQDIDSDYSGKFSHVPSQRAVVPKSSIYVEPRPKHAIWYMEFVDSTQIFNQGILHSTNPSATGSIPVRPVASGEERIGSTSPMPMSARRPPTMNSFLPAEVLKSSLAVQQRLQILELQFDTFATPSSFSCWKTSFKTQVSSCSGSPSEASNVVVQRSGDGRLGGRFEIIAPKSGFYSFTEFWDAGCQDCNCSEQDHPEFLLQEKGHSGGTESSERRSVPSRKTDRFHDLRILSGRWGQWCCRELWRTFYSCSSKWWYSGIRFKMGLYNMRIRESDQLKTVLELYDMEIHQKISTPNLQKFKTMVKRSIDQKLRWRKFDRRNERIGTGAVVASRRG